MGSFLQPRDHENKQMHFHEYILTAPDYRLFQQTLYAYLYRTLFLFQFLIKGIMLYIRYQNKIFS